MARPGSELRQPGLLSLPQTTPHTMIRSRDSKMGLNQVNFALGLQSQWLLRGGGSKGNFRSSCSCVSKGRNPFCGQNMFLSNMSPKVMLFSWLLLYGSVSRGRRRTETCAGSLVCKIRCKIVFSVCEGWKGARRCLQRAEVARTGDRGQWPLESCG